MPAAAGRQAGRHADRAAVISVRSTTDDPRPSDACTKELQSAVAGCDDAPRSFDGLRCSKPETHHIVYERIKQLLFVFDRREF